MDPFQGRDGIRFVRVDGVSDTAELVAESSNIPRHVSHLTALTPMCMPNTLERRQVCPSDITAAPKSPPHLAGADALVEVMLET